MSDDDHDSDPPPEDHTEDDGEPLKMPGPDTEHRWCTECERITRWRFDDRFWQVRCLEHAPTDRDQNPDLHDAQDQAQLRAEAQARGEPHEPSYRQRADAARELEQRRGDEVNTDPLGDAWRKRRTSTQ